MPTSPLLRIAIILEGRVQYERNVLRGIREFAAQREDWLLRLELPNRGTPAFLDQWKPHGILFQGAGLPRETLEVLGELDHPAIHLSEAPPGESWTSVGLDNPAIGRAAADYLLERRFDHFAFAGQQDVGFSERRGRAFRRRLEAAGHDLSVLELAPDTGEPEVLDWLGGLPKPCGLFATHDECALFLATLCRGAGIALPEDLGLLGVDNDTLLCELAWPPLSSVAVPSERVGFEAAGLLQGLIDGDARSRPESILLPPTGIVSRLSTDVDQTGDETVNRALRFIRAHLHRRINVEDVLREVGVSRRLLERRFTRHLGRSPLQEIQRQRVELIRRLLVETDLPLHEIATRSGCADASRLVTLFRKATGQTPGEFRRGR